MDVSVVVVVSYASCHYSLTGTESSDEVGTIGVLDQVFS